jgi:hypothetical protein
VHDIQARGLLWTVRQPSGDVVWWVKACAGDVRGLRRLRYLELIAGGFRDNLEVQRRALDRSRD